MVDVGGGSTELVCRDGRRRASLVGVVAGRLGPARRRATCAPTRRRPPSSTPCARTVAGAFDGLDAPRPDVAYAVGGSATSLRRLVGAELDRATLARGARACSPTPPRAEVAARYELHPERVRLLPAGISCCSSEAADAFGAPLQIARGGLREGVVLERRRR